MGHVLGRAAALIGAILMVAGLVLVATGQESLEAQMARADCRRMIRAPIACPPDPGLLTIERILGFNALVSGLALTLIGLTAAQTAEANDRLKRIEGRLGIAEPAPTLTEAEAPPAESAVSEMARTGAGRIEPKL